MTDRGKNWLSIALISAIVAVTSAWAVTEYRVGRLESVVERIDNRIAEMYCDGKPPGCR
jgi:hypothetical protein